MLETTIQQATKMKYGVCPEKTIELGGGFYGRAFLVFLPFEPYKVVAKLYLFPHFAIKEANQLKTLAKHGLLKVPSVYDILDVDSTGLSYDVLFMEYVRGANAGVVDVSQLSEAVKNDIGEKIIDNILLVHSTIHEEGFGELDAKEYYPTWQEYYYPITQNILEKAKALLEQGQLSEHVLAVMGKAVNNFDSIFYLPITEARLIHGDYNTWNVMLDWDKTKAIAFLDPFGCCWADSEFDLYQLDNANGKEFGLLERYSQKKQLSLNHKEKRCFYELFTEINHYYDSHVTVDLKAVERLATRLEKVLLDKMIE